MKQWENSSARGSHPALGRSAHQLEGAWLAWKAPVSRHTSTRTLYHAPPSGKEPRVAVASLEDPMPKFSGTKPHLESWHCARRLNLTAHSHAHFVLRTCQPMHAHAVRNPAPFLRTSAKSEPCASLLVVTQLLTPPSHVASIGRYRGPRIAPPAPASYTRTCE